jgi:hypothetical protein
MMQADGLSSHGKARVHMHQPVSTLGVYNQNLGTLSGCL